MLCGEFPCDGHQAGGGGQRAINSDGSEIGLGVDTSLHEASVRGHDGPAVLAEPLPKEELLPMGVEDPMLCMARATVTDPSHRPVGDA